MKKYNSFFKFSICLGFVLALSSCEEKVAKDWETTLFGKGEAMVGTSSTSIDFGESVTFTDLSTKVNGRSWSFAGGTPATSMDSIVTVTYARGGSYKASLSVVYIDNQRETLDTQIEVAGPPPADNPQPTFSDSYAFYTEYSKVGAGTSVTVQNNSGFTISSVADGYEGYEAYEFKFDTSVSWAMASVKPVSAANISKFKDGFYNVALRSTSAGTVELQIRSSGQKALVVLDATSEKYGFKRDGEWHLLEIPMADFLANNANLDLAAITDILVFRSQGTLTGVPFDFDMDNLFVSVK